MTAEQKKLLRDALCAGLVAQFPISISAATLKGVARAAGFQLTDAELAFELAYLIDKGLAVETPERVSAGAKRWKATADTIEYCEQEGLI